jgi:hypothetical protein
MFVTRLTTRHAVGGITERSTLLLLHIWEGPIDRANPYLRSGPDDLIEILFVVPMMTLPS